MALLSESKKDILRLVTERPGITVRELAEIRGTGETTTRRLVRKMFKEELLVREKTGRGLAGGYRYYLPLEAGK